MFGDVSNLLLPFCVSSEKPEESQAPKPAKKKKARRETWDHSADLCMQKTSYPVYATPFVRRTLTKVFVMDLNLKTCLEIKTTFIHVECLPMDHWKLNIDAVQSNVMRC